MGPTNFTDRFGRTWDLTLDLAKCRKIDSSDFSQYTTDKFSILKPDKKLFWYLIGDTSLLYAVIWAALVDEAQAKFEAGQFPISPKESPAEAELEFVSGINGSVREAGRQAFVEGLMDFFPEQRTVLSTLLKQITAMRTKVDQKVKETEPLMDELVDQELDDLVDKIRKELKTQSVKHGDLSTSWEQ